MRIHILGLPRTGTTYLLELCHRHYNNSIALNEPFNKGIRDSIEIEQNLNVITENSKVVVKNLTYDLNTMEQDFPDLYQKFNDSIDYSIKIIRGDIVSSTLSNAYSIATKDWTSNKNKVTPIVTIDTKKFISLFDEHVDSQKSLSLIKTDAEVIYEDMIQNPLETWNSFNIQPVKVLKNINMTKNPPKENYIHNLEELKAIAEKRLQNAGIKDV